MSFTYAWGPALLASAVPASAFSRGDLLVYNSGSSLSLAPPLTTTLDIAGIAMADSNKSVLNQVPYLIPAPETVFFSRATPGSQFTPGYEADLVYAAGTGWTVMPSANTARVAIQRGTQDLLGQSVSSRVLVKLIYHAGALEHS